MCLETIEIIMIAGDKGAGKNKYLDRVEQNEGIRAVEDLVDNQDPPGF